jgi:ATP-dependent helicase Lhr and Lhr-like helicase
VRSIFGERRPTAFDGNIGTLDGAAIEAVVEEAWPLVRDADELFDVLQVLGWLPSAIGEPWQEYCDMLVTQGRVLVFRVSVEGASKAQAVEGWATREHVPRVQALFAQAEVVAGRQNASLICP